MEMIIASDKEPEWMSIPQALFCTAGSMLNFSSSATGADWWDIPTTSTLMHIPPQSHQSFD
ncbi:hypothetical protein CFL01nite_07160 [Corynebacterium flavescens]|uniref:Uncharacterized protein n=1 Tax=Corynebacterium flavescens TaxID=28028 RepID=A0AB73B6P8_CORFL|nr:hypothetical protein CFL01nite_07160 [Corynebacterium flavescens]